MLPLKVQHQPVNLCMQDNMISLKYVEYQALKGDLELRSKRGGCVCYSYSR